MMGAGETSRTRLPHGRGSLTLALTPAVLLLLGGLAVAPALSSQPETPQEVQKSAEPEDEMLGWKWANFVVLAGVLLCFGVKFGKPYFAGQTETLRKGLEEARRRREEAERRAAEVQTKLANLGAEIASFRQSVLTEQGVQAERLRRQAEEDLLHVQANSAQQIETLGKHLRLELRRHASQLALELAEQRIRGRMTPAAQQSLTDRFIQGLRA